ncbi:uncharacterized protein PADG_11276 [Paracoccidioides brasiliensis Pb18]|uniref:Retrovirus-related Pol polyprotein from transposon TNT 1-94-like beta-barrel domain-containing protein n=1 Tax=Paracoccidioides brasiliensis (strain Pb18) TaxID=502780 RepID=A0A0A0HTB8_PARBD|nr:uncharacterized protein PADG_11276 [Paracoccidioides brasiliensis Pb18]KGM92459.1 hypothetical protein PADG_11276 [Paracoccidioides brasiliensis Pb18]
MSSEISSKPQRYLYTGASFHMSGERHLMTRPKSFKGNLKVSMADGGQRQVKKIGDILLESEVGDVMVCDVHWILNLTVNLLSFVKLKDQGFRFELSSSTPSYFIIHAPKGAIFNAIRTPQNSIYKIVEQDLKNDVHHASKVVNHITQFHDYGDAMATVNESSVQFNKPTGFPQKKWRRTGTAFTHSSV